jgi:hypothetical protein
MSTLPFYRTPERRAALIAAAHSWLHTPFAENCAVRGPQGGVDCVHFLAAVHAEAGACEPIELPVLPVEQVRSWHVHHAESKILEWFGRPELRGRVRRLDDGEPMMAGDMPVLRLEQTEHHLALWAAPSLYHVAIPAGVVAHSVRDPEILKRVRCVYRVFGL